MANIPFAFYFIVVKERIFYMNIERLLKLLEERNITRYRLSKLTGINESTITRLINEKIKIQN